MNSDGTGKWDQGQVILSGEGLSISKLIAVARGCQPVALSGEPAVQERTRRACASVQRAVEEGQIIYGVTTGFGGLSDVLISADQREALQDNMLWFLKAGVGSRLPTADVRAAMLLRANSHLRGASGIRLELIERLLILLNAGVTPHVPELGSIGASGDLIPLAYITGALIGHEAGFKVEFNGGDTDAIQALRTLGLPRLKLQPKEAWRC